MKIAEVSKLLDISADTLRYYERIGLIPKIHRDKSGNRDYTELTDDKEIREQIQRFYWKSMLRDY